MVFIITGMWQSTITPFRVKLLTPVNSVLGDLLKNCVLLQPLIMYVAQYHQDI